jgi:hypothetical protein
MSLGRLAAVCGIGAAAISAAPQGSTNNAGGATDPGPHRERPEGAVTAAGPAFHTGITVCNGNLSIIEGKNTVGADLGAAATTDAFSIIELQRNNVSKILHSVIHYALQAQYRCSVMPDTAENMRSGKAILISFFTPERDV